MIIHCLLTKQNRDHYSSCLCGWYVDHWQQSKANTRYKRSITTSLQDKGSRWIKVFLKNWIHWIKCWYIDASKEVCSWTTAAKPVGTPIDISVKLTSKVYDEHVKKEQVEADDPLVDQTIKD